MAQFIHKCAHVIMYSPSLCIYIFTRRYSRLEQAPLEVVHKFGEDIDKSCLLFSIDATLPPHGRLSKSPKIITWDLPYINQIPYQASHHMTVLVCVKCYTQKLL